MVVTRFGSSIDSLFMASTSRGNSLGCFGSTAIVMTGSETYFMRSKGNIMSLCSASMRVSPALARSRPNKAAMLPAVISPATSLKAPMYMETCCTRYSFFALTR